MPRCPSNEKEWISAAERKNCSALENCQTCSKDRSFVYHCVLNKNATELVEVCAPIWYMSGKYWNTKVSDYTQLASLRNSSDLSFYKYIQRIIAYNAILCVNQEKTIILPSMKYIHVHMKYIHVHVYTCNTKNFTCCIILLLLKQDFAPALAWPTEE